MARDYILSVADSIGHVPDAPARTARRELRTRADVHYRVFPSAEAMARAMRSRAWRTEGWRACPVPGITCTVCGQLVAPTSASVRLARPTCSDTCTLALWAEDVRR
jgi:hypothetical protein